MRNYPQAKLSNIKPITIYLILIVLVFGTSLYKIIKVKNNSHFNPSSPGSLYYAEAAFQYRYAEIIAKGGKNILHTLKNDRFVQYPETINVFKYYTIMMEFFYGFLYRIFNLGLPFNLFFIYTNSFFSSLLLIMVFLITKKLFKNDLVSLGAVLYYITTPASYLRTAAGSFLQEDFALVFLLLSAWLIMMQLDAKSNPLLSCITGLAIVFSLSSWHFSHFIYICMLPFFFWIFAQRPNLLKNFSYAFLIIFLAGFFIPVLKTSVFLTSILMCGLYALLIAYFLKKFTKKPSSRLVLTLFIFTILLGTRNITGLYEPAYSHVFDMFFEKLKFLLKKPDNPMLLSFSARQLWESAFNSPTPGEIWWFGKLAFPLGIIGSFFLLWSERKKPNSGTFIASLSIILFLLSIMAKRILVVCAPFVAVELWGCAIYRDKTIAFGDNSSRQVISGIMRDDPASLFKQGAGKVRFLSGFRKVFYTFLYHHHKKNYLKIGLYSLVILNALGLNLEPIEGGRFTPASYSELFTWINSNTQPTDAFVAHIHLSPMVLLNTGRPEVLHPKFENLPIRKKYEELIMSMYNEDERNLFEFCKKNKAKYLIYDWGFFITDGKDSMRYLGGAVPDISEKAMAARLHFSSPELKHFKPLFRNSAFIIYGVVENADSEIKKMPYSPIYDHALYTKENGFYKHTRQTYDELIIPYAEKVNHSSFLLNSQEAFIVVDILEPVVKKIPRGSEGIFVLGQAYVQLKQYEKAEKLLKDYLNLLKLRDDLVTEPLSAKISELLADVLYYQGRYDESFDALNDCLKLPSHSADVYKKLGILSQLDQKQEQAEQYFQQYKEYQDRK